MDALSVRQPWCLAILRGGKRVENRDWLTSPGNVSAAHARIGKSILLHASAWWSMQAVADMLDGFRDIARKAPEWVKPGEMTIAQLRTQTGGIVGRFTLANVTRTLRNGCRVPFYGGLDPCLLCGEIRLGPRMHDACPKADPWAVPGAVGLTLADVEPVPFVPFKGALGFFDVPDSLLTRAA